MTFSIVAVDREAKEVGLAIASCCWDAGQVCMAQAEVGAIASQASGNLAFLPRFFKDLSQGGNPATILAGFKSTDEEIESRQIGMIQYDGEALAFTGTRCTPWAGHRTGRDYACQGNTLVGPRVVDAMSEAFEQTEGSLRQRLYAALAAGDAAGGDIRGRQSARLAVKKKGYGQPGTDSLVDFAIEDHANPVGELGRIFGVAGTLMHILSQLGAFSHAAGADKPAILDHLRQYLDDKRDCRYLDWWESLGDGLSRDRRHRPRRGRVQDVSGDQPRASPGAPSGRRSRNLPRRPRHPPVRVAPSPGDMVAIPNAGAAVPRGVVAARAGLV